MSLPDLKITGPHASSPVSFTSGTSSAHNEDSKEKDNTSDNSSDSKSNKKRSDNAD